MALSRYCLACSSGTEILSLQCPTAYPMSETSKISPKAAVTAGLATADGAVVTTASARGPTAVGAMATVGGSSKSVLALAVAIAGWRTAAGAGQRTVAEGSLAAVECPA